MNSLLKVAGILGGSVMVATAVISPSSDVVVPVETEIIQELPNNESPAKAVESVEILPPPDKEIFEIQEVLEVKEVVIPVRVSPPPTSSCHPNYSGCLKVNAGDYDCEQGTGNGPNYTGLVEVYGSDPFDLDRDKNGWGCE
jgi:hypothetical protein